MIEKTKISEQPVDISTLDGFRDAVYRYHRECEEANDGAGILPDMAGLRLYLGLTKADLSALATGDSDFAVGVRRTLEEAQDMRESWLARKMTSDNKRAIGCLNALKQPENGGYVDKPVQDAERTLTINVSGIKGGENAFK